MSNYPEERTLQLACTNSTLKKLFWDRGSADKVYTDRCAHFRKDRWICPYRLCFSCRFQLPLIILYSMFTGTFALK